MTKQDLITVNAALESCSGSVTLLKDDKPTAVHFRFSGKTRLSIADAQLALEPQIKAIESATKAIVKQHGGPWEKPCDAQAACQAELDDMLNAPADIAFTLPLAEFERDDNPVPAAVIKILRPYLK